MLQVARRLGEQVPRPDAVDVVVLVRGEQVAGRRPRRAGRRGPRGRGRPPGGSPRRGRRAARRARRAAPRSPRGRACRARTSPSRGRRWTVVAGELDQRAPATSSPGRPPSANATASRTSGSVVGALGEQPGLAVRRAEVAEGARDRRQDLGVGLALGHRAQRGVLLARAAPARRSRAARARRRRARAPPARRRRSARPSRRAPPGVPRAASAHTCGCHSSSRSAHSARAPLEQLARARGPAAPGRGGS